MKTRRPFRLCSPSFVFLPFYYLVNSSFAIAVFIFSFGVALYFLIESNIIADLLCFKPLFPLHILQIT